MLFAQPFARVFQNLILVCALALMGAATLHAANEEARILYEAALQNIADVDLDQSVEAFQAVVSVDDKYAPAHFQIAKLYMSKPEHQDRLRAERALTRAIKLDPENIEYRMTFGDLLWMQGKWEASTHLFSELLEKDPQNARAAYQIGYRSLKEFLKYKDMEDYESGVRFTWDHFAVKDRDKAVEYLSRSVKLDPEFQDPYYQLGLIFYESNEFGKLIEISKALLGQDPKAKDAYLFCGLGYQMVNDQDQAFDYYTQAIERMSGEERGLMESVEHVATEEEKRSIQGDDGKTTRDGFWRRQDPLFLTDYNERKMEHYGRVAYANLAHSRPSKGLAGWQTDKGMTHIRFGKPLHRRVQRPEVSQGSGRLIQAHEERWFFEGMVVTFQNWDGLDGWRFRQMQRPGETPRHSPMKVEARYVDPYRWQKYTLPYMVAAFREDGRTRIEVAYAIPRNRIDPVEPELETGIFLFDSEWEPVYRNVAEQPLREPSGEDSLRQQYMLIEQTVYADPGTYQVVGEVRDKIEDSIGSFRLTQTSATPDDSLDVSDLLLATHIETDDPFPERRDQLDIVPNPLRTYRQNESVFIYMEIYDLQRDAFGRTAYDVSYRVGWPTNIDVIDPGLFEAVDMVDREAYLEVEERGDGGSLRQDGQDQVAAYEVNYVLPERNRIVQELKDQIKQGKGVETTVTARYEGDRTDDLTYLQIDVGEVPPGIHELTIDISDANSGRSVTRSALFKVVE